MAQTWYCEPPHTGETICGVSTVRGGIQVKRFLVLVCSSALAVSFASLPAGAEAKTKRIASGITVDVLGIIDRHGGVTYAFAGAVGAEGYTFACMGDRQVTLFRVEPNGTARPVASATTDLGGFTGTLERPLGEISGSYYAEVAPRTRKFKSGNHRKLRCLGARSPTILVQVPAALLGSQ
jgi:hypothetical protein